MCELNFGSLERRHLSVRIFVPRSWNVYDFRVWCQRWRGGSHRCFCDKGRMFDGGVSFFGLSLIWFYSHYFGPLPCICNEVMDTWERKRLVRATK